MKIRSGFVSNSSSSSFVIDRKFVSQDMLDKICAHEDVASEYDSWTIRVEDDEIFCSTIMDNFDLMGYVREIGIPKEAFKDESGDNY